MIRRKLLRNMLGKQQEAVDGGTRAARGGDWRGGSGMIRGKLLRNMLEKQQEAVDGGGWRPVAGATPEETVPLRLQAGVDRPPRLC